MTKSSEDLICGAFNPFWQMTARNPKATYVRINCELPYCPKEIEKQAICINEDIDTVFKALNSIKCAKE